MKLRPYPIPRRNTKPNAPQESPPTVVLMRPSDLKPSPHNVRTHSKKQRLQIANSIVAVGFRFPILVDERGVIIAGHGRHMAAMDLGLPKVPVIVAKGLCDAQKRALALADNKMADNAGYDRKKLDAELGALAPLLQEINLDISITGFEPAEIDSLAVDFRDPEQDPADDIPLPAPKPVSRIGDLWQLGPHRLVNGDAGSNEAVKRLMSGASAQMIIADPPYNVVVGQVVGRGKTKHREFVEASGELTSLQYTDFLTGFMSSAARYSDDGSMHYVFMDWRHLEETLTAGKKAYTELKNIVVWVKTNAGQGSFYRSQHELIFVFKNGEAPHLNNIELGKHGRNRSNVWTYAGVNTFRAGRMDDLSVHPTVKPVALVADAMRDCTRRDDIVLDPFMGSGTTILAAERIGRHAYGLEIDPLYVDVAIRRWQSFTRRDAILESTGQTFDEVAEHGPRHNKRRAR